MTHASLCRGGEIEGEVDIAGAAGLALIFL